MQGVSPRRGRPAGQRRSDGRRGGGGESEAGAHKLLDERPSLTETRGADAMAS